MGQKIMYLILFVFYLTFSESDYSASNNWMTVNNEFEWKRKKASCPNLRQYPVIILEGLREATK
jgi:hypothetical protein